MEPRTPPRLRSARSRPWARAALALGVWTALLLVFATQYWVALRVAGEPVSWASQVRRELPGWALWALLAPLVFAAARRLPLNTPQRARNLLLHLGVATGLYGLYLALYNAAIALLPLRPDIARAGLGFGELMWQGAQLNFAFFGLLYAGVMSVYHVLAYGRAYRGQELRASQLETRLAQARLDALRMQLRPHFLFNTLHGVSALMERDPRRARRMLANLSDLLRASIDATDELVPLAEEIGILERYLEIQRLRFGDRLRAAVDVDPSCRARPVPRFLLQPLVENAIEHGLAKRAAPGCIAICAARAGNALELRVSDDGPGFPEAPGGRPAGVGLGNTRARLEALYGERFELRLENRPEGGADVHIRIPDGREAGTGHA